jgi:hypothetical protein
MTKTNRFLQLAKPDANGKTKWIDVSIFIGQYKDLAFGNGASWARKESTLAKKYIVVFDKTITPGNGIDRIKLDGYNKVKIGNQNIKSSIKQYYRNRRCVVLYTSGNAGKPIEIDHKNGRKNNPKVMNVKTQLLIDFQPLSKAANDAKRQHCKNCATTNNRFDATSLGYKKSYYKGVHKHNGQPGGCEGCYWYDPVEFRKNL